MQKNYSVEHETYSWLNCWQWLVSLNVVQLVLNICMNLLELANVTFVYLYLLICKCH
jgi:hypothetical protein